MWDSVLQGYTYSARKRPTQRCVVVKNPVDLKHGSVGKGLAMEAWGPEFNPQSPRQKDGGGSLCL